MNRTFQSFLVLIAFSLSALSASAQVQRGTPPFGSFGGGPDAINLGNLNVRLVIPVLHKPGRGGQDFNYDITYDSSVWRPVTSGGTTTWQPDALWGWNGSIPRAAGYVTYYTGSLESCRFFQETQWITEHYHFLSDWVYYDGFGTPHPMIGGIQDGGAPDCGPDNYALLTTNDGSGYKYETDTETLYTVFGAVGVLIGQTFTDRNGNKINVNGSGQFFDTLSSSTPVLTVASTGSPTTQTTYTYTAPSGASAAFTMIYTTYSIQTNFGCTSPNIGEYGTNGSTTANLVTEIRLPDWNQSTNPNSRYTFAYEQTPSHAGFYTGRIASITLPTGGVISYTYTAGALTGTAVGANDPIVCADGSAAGIQRKTPDTGSNYWNYSRNLVSGNEWTTTVTTPPDPSVGNDTVIYFQKDSATVSNGDGGNIPLNNFYETQRKAYQGSSGSGTLLQTVDTCYNLATAPCFTTAVSSPITQRDVLPSIPSAGGVTLQAKHTTKYNTAGGPIETDDYAFGSGTFGALLRQTLITYASLGNITAFRQTVTVKNGSGTVLAQTNYNYDQTTPVNAPSGTPQLTNPPGSSRGNLTSVQLCTNLTNCSTNLQTTMTYDTAGQTQTVKDPLNNQTSFSYTDNFLDDDGSNPPSHAHAALGYPTDAYVTSITPPLNGAITFKYYYYNGATAVSTDQNQNKSWSHFDSFGRPLSSYGPPLLIAGTQNTANPWTLINYTSLTQVDTYTDINDTSTTATASCSVCRHDEGVVDGLGRPITAYLKSDPEGNTEVDGAFDALGRAKTLSHPYRTTGDNTYGIETPTYDALGRTIKVMHPDGSYSQTLFGAAVTGSGVNTTQLCSSTTYGLGFPVLAFDEAGKKRESWTDALGRTIEADEPDSSGNLTSNTCYSYDSLGNLLQIVRGSQTRTYGYDTLSRVNSVSIPELANCAVTYGYDNNSNLQTRTAPAPNQTSCSTTVTTTYYHDALNRLTKISYGATSPVATPTAQYGYDGNALSGCATTPPTLTDSNPKGRMTSMCDGSGATSWAHDAAGSIITEKRTIQGTSAVTQTTSYSYNLDSSAATVTYPSGKTVTYSVSNAQRLTAANDTANSVQFATAASYSAPGGLSGVITGQISGGFGGITESHNYNSSLEYTSTKATSSAGTAMDLTLNYALPGGDNGTITSITNNADTGRTQALAYDPLNRISSATTQATSGTDCWGQNFVPDALANLNTITSAQCSSNSLSVTVDGSNHITTSGFGYDAAGNTLQDGSGTGYSYSFDAENRLVKANGMTGAPWCYVYDGNGLRVAKKSGANSDCTGGTVTKLYWRSLSGDAIAETDGSGSTTNSAYIEYVFFAGRRIASRVGPSNGNSSIFYYFADQLGSTRTITTGSGSGQTPGQLCYDADFTPYGQEISHGERLQTTACPPNYKFTGYERDSETGLDYAFARYYSSRLGRFLSTDPLGGAVGSLQSHNAYAYALNNPFYFTDPLGLATCTLNILLDNSAGVTGQVLDSLKSQVQAVLAQGSGGDVVSINFVSQGGDFTLKLQNPGVANYLTFSGIDTPNGATACVPLTNICSSTAKVNVGNTQMNFGLSVASAQKEGNGLGTVAAHELVHAITGADDLDYKKGGNLMSLGSNPNAQIVAQGFGVSPDKRLTDKQIRALIDACKKKRKNQGGGGRLQQSTGQPAGWWVLAISGGGGEGGGYYYTIAWFPNPACGDATINLCGPKDRN